MAQNGDDLGPLIRLWGIRTDQLPPGPLPGGGDDDGSDGNTEELSRFLRSLLGEAIPFIDSLPAPPKDEGSRSSGDETKTANPKRKVWKPKGTKSYNITGPSPSSSSPSPPPPPTGSVHANANANAKVKVELFERSIKSKDLEDIAATAAIAGTRKPEGPVPVATGETWVCRRSIHEDKKGVGAASWEEFRESFKERHPETEALFTDSVVRMDKKVVWDCKGVPPQKVGSETWSDFTLCILEARHRVGKPLKDRTFPILQMTCSAVDAGAGGATSTNTGRDRTPPGANPSATTIEDTTHGTRHKQTQTEKQEFVIISVTVPDYFHSDICKGPGGSSSGSSSRTGTETDTVIASYASIERIRKVPGGSGGGSGDAGNDAIEKDRKIEWLMALTSDAGGVLPRWIQNLAVPGQIAKDVPLFLGWIAKERERKKKNQNSQGAEGQWGRGSD